MCLLVVFSGMSMAFLTASPIVVRVEVDQVSLPWLKMVALWFSMSKPMKPDFVAL